MVSDPTERNPRWAEETQQLNPVPGPDETERHDAVDEDAAPTAAFNDPDQTVQAYGERTVALDPEDAGREAFQPGTAILGPQDGDAYGFGPDQADPYGAAGSGGQYGSMPEPEQADYGYEPYGQDGYPEQGGRWGTGILVIMVLIALIAGILLGSVFARLTAPGSAEDTVPRATLEEQQAAADAALQEGQAQIEERDAQIAELETRLGQAQQEQEGAAAAQLAEVEERQRTLDDRAAALDAREQALDEREQALDEREQALDEREQALEDADPGPGVNLPTPELPDLRLPEDEEGRSLLDRLLDRLSGSSD